MTFPSVEELQSLAQAREAFAELLATHKTVTSERDQALEDLQSAKDEADSIKGDLGAANEMLEEANRTITSLNADLQQAGEREESLRNELQKAKEEADNLIGEMQKAKEEARSLTERIGQLESEAKSVEAKAAEICASVGVDPARITPAGEDKQVSLLEQMREIENPAEQMAFFRKHREAILPGA